MMLFAAQLIDAHPDLFFLAAQGAIYPLPTLSAHGINNGQHQIDWGNKQKKTQLNTAEVIATATNGQYHWLFEVHASEMT